MSWIGSLFGGSSPELNTIISQFGQTAGNQLAQGQNYTNQAGNFSSAILSGDATKQMQAIGPEVSAAKTSAAQDQKKNSMFGTRSGGTAAKNASSSDKLHSDITNLLGNLTGGAASNLANLGTSMTNTGLGALTSEQGAVQQRMQNWSDSIFGKGLTGAAAFGESAGLNYLSGLGGSGNDDNSST